MPITGRTPRECFDQFEQHIRELINTTLAVDCPLNLIQLGVSGQLTFRRGGPVGVSLQTRLGTLYLYLWQVLDALEEGGGYRLTTRQYAYRLQEGPSMREDRALIRWEYDRKPGHAHPRHHVQIDGTLESQAAGTVHLGKLHLPTGWVTIEELIRFLIADLEVRPTCGAEWPAVLERSESRFYEDFTSKRYEPPSAGQR